jgi:hypothetical protein
MDGWMDGWMDGRMNEWVDGWMNGTRLKPVTRLYHLVYNLHFVAHKHIPAQLFYVEIY